MLGIAKFKYGVLILSDSDDILVVFYWKRGNALSIFIQQYSTYNWSMNSCSENVVVHRLIEVKRLTDQTEHDRIQQKEGISLMAE